MKRHPALQDLSRDHHFVLIKCQSLRRALERRAPPEELRDLAEDLLRFYRSDMAPHFQEEDDFVVPEAERTGTAELVAAAREVHQDHGWLRARIERLGRVVGGAAAVARILAEIEPRITRHVQLEEERLFEGLQRALDESALQAMWRRSYAFRVKHRAPSACQVHPRVR